MFRWPVELTPLSLGSVGATREATLEITPRGAAFTLAALSHVGHGAHLALIDAYLKGQVRLTETTGIGDDSRIVAASLAAPLIAAYELGIERLTLGDLILLPRDLDAASMADRAPSGVPIRSGDSACFLLRDGDTWSRVRAAEHFEEAGCLGTRRVGVGEPWHDLIALLPEPGEIEAHARAGRWPAPLTAELREPSLAVRAPSAAQRGAIRGLDLARFSESGPHPLTPSTNYGAPPLRGIPVSSGRGGVTEATLPKELAETLAEAPSELEIDITLVPGLDGYRTLCLLPPAHAEPEAILPAMRDAAWASVERLIGRPLVERRSESIALRLVGPERTTTLEIGESLVIVRNQAVFAAWLGSDGRVMVRLFPPATGSAGA